MFDLLQGDDRASTGAHLLYYASGIVGWLAVAWFGTRLVDLLLHRAAATGHANQTPRLLNDLLHALLYAIAAVAILVFVFQQEATGLIAPSSVMIAVIGFSLRYVISDVFSGIVLNFDHPYRIGDWIEPANGVLGKVTEITWRTTRLETREGTTVVVPNGLISTGRLINLSAPGESFRVALRLWLDPRLTVERAKKTLLMATFTVLRVYPDLRPDVLVLDIGESGVLYLVRFWVPDGGEENACRDAVVAAIINTMQRYGIALSPPKREITLIQADEEARPPTLEPPSRDTLLDECELFRPFTLQEREAMALHLIEHRYRKGDVVFERGAPGGTLFFVADGAFEVRVPTTAVSPGLTLDYMVPGDIFGEISFLTGEPRSATVIAIMDAQLYEVTKEAIEPFLWQRPELFDRLAALMVARQKQNKNRLDATGEKTESDDLVSRIRIFFGIPKQR